jgi:predicted peroxiredoxin
MGNLELNKKRNPDIKGYVIFDNVWKRPLKIITSEPAKYTMDSVFINSYESFIKDCTAAGVKLYIVCSPYYELSPYNDTSIVIGKQIAHKYKVDFFDYTKDTSLIKQPALFSDSMHLNDDGAVIFSNMVADEILKAQDRGMNAQK